LVPGTVTLPLRSCPAILDFVSQDQSVRDLGPTVAESSI